MERKRKEVHSCQAGDGGGGVKVGPLGPPRADPEAGRWSFPPTPLSSHLPGKVTQS